MQFLFFIFFLLPLCVQANLSTLFSEEEDISLYHHVHVITGQLNICFQDVTVPGAVPYSLQRTYTSAGALEADEVASDLKGMSNGWLIQGGWNLLPHIHLFEREGRKQKHHTFSIIEKNGAAVTYVFEKQKHGEWIFKPEETKDSKKLAVNPRMDPQRNRLHFDFKHREARLHLADGGRRTYKLKEERNSYAPDCNHLVLTKEVMPSQHVIEYRYDGESSLKEIAVKNPSCSKRFASMRIRMKQVDYKHHPFHIQVDSSSHQHLDYRSTPYKGRHYLSDVQSNCRPKEASKYVFAGKGGSARMQTLQLDDREQFHVHYYTPPNKSSEKRWEKHPKERPLCMGKVSKLEAPLGEGGGNVVVAEFTYFPTYTDVRDAHHILTRYHHENHQLSLIEFFDEKDKIHTSLRLMYEGNRLKAKAVLDATQTPLFAKAFQYDEEGNVIREVFSGDLTGSVTKRMTLQENGVLKEGETFTKDYAYEPGTHLLSEEREEQGLTYKYRYKPNTDLVTAKFTCEENQIVQRQFYLYDEDHLLIAEVTDDGNSENLEDISEVTSRYSKRYTLDPNTGMPLVVAETYLEGGQEKLLKRTQLAYSPENRVSQEILYDANDHYCYTLYTEYDSYGRILSKTTPTGAKNTYTYGPQGELTRSKEVGSLEKTFTYNRAGLPLSSTEIATDGRTKTTLFTYDAKGRALSYTDPLGNTTFQVYNPFGQCIETRFPKIQAGTPVAQFSYDDLGNLASTLSPLGHRIETKYTAFNKPSCIIHPDGSQTLHLYDKRGLLVETLHPDLTTVHYAYDRFQRMVLQTTLSSTDKLLSQETWVYDTFHLLSYTNPQGTVTTYAYDGMGRLCSEKTEERLIQYSYDSLGFLEKKTLGAVSEVKRHDKAGFILEEWREDDTGNRENYTTYEYDSEGHKIRAHRQTSQGIVTDLFGYDSEGKLCSHMDPLGAQTLFIYQEILNNLNQNVAQKITIDPLQNRTLETYDALGHIVSQEKQNPQGNTVSREIFCYDLAGNKIARNVTLYQGTTPTRETLTTWEYDPFGRPITQKEPEHKITHYTYNCQGQLSSKTLPNGTLLYYTYDGLGRLLERSSSDHTIHDVYIYDQGSNPLEIKDLIHGTTLKRTYNSFGQPLSEINAYGLVTQWQYDNQGRCTQLILPDHSSIVYLYQGAHLTTVQRRSPEGQPLYAHQYLQFDPNGHVTKEQLIQNLGLLHTTHDLLERPSTQTSPYLHHATTYGPSGLVIAQTNSLLGNKQFTYDSLSQLTQEGLFHYNFDSLGNPLECTTNAQNQILATPTSTYVYDPNGNPIEKNTPEKTAYTYDALGRLTSIATPEKTTTYIYDPLSRLIATQDSSQLTLFLYDDQQEIGTCTPSAHILQLKVLGLGIREDIGATIAIELGPHLFAPLHDFSGHIIALIATDATLYETYPIDAFGKQTLQITSLNPWRFCSKRSLDGLIYFGQRFYDPALGRWLTPDPAGFIDGPNLYAYVLNNPLNRLDTFGLSSEELPHFDPKKDHFSLKIPFDQVPQLHASPSIRQMVQGRAKIGHSETDFVIIGLDWHKLHLTPEEEDIGTVNLFDHFQEMFPNKGSMIGLITVQNGICTHLTELRDMVKTTANLVSEGTWVLGLHNPSWGLVCDLSRVATELREEDTATVCRTRQFMVAIARGLNRVNPDMRWLHIAHSEGSLVGVNAINGMNPEERALMKQHLSAFGIAPARPFSKEYTADARNVYSVKDKVTKRYAGPYLKNTQYDIQFLECTSTEEEMSFFSGDHAFFGNTYQKGLETEIRRNRDEYGFYNAKTR